MITINNLAMQYGARLLFTDVNLNLNSNADKNSKLCQRYLDEMKVDLLTCNVRKLSSHHAGIRAALLAAPAPAPIIQAAQDPESDSESEQDDEQDDEPSDDDQVEQAPPSPLPNLVPDSVREVGPSVHQRITCVTGKKIIEYWRNSGEHQTTLDKTLDDIIISYQDRCAQDQLQDTLKFINPSTKCKILLALIKKKHPLPEDDMRKGIELLRTYSEAFGDAAVAGL